MGHFLLNVARRHNLAASLPAVLLASFFFLLIGLPLALVMLQAVLPKIFDPLAPSTALDISVIFDLFQFPRSWIAILHSVELALVVGVAGTVLGGGLAFLVIRCDLPFRHLIGMTPWLVFLTPSYLKTVAWVLLMSPGGYLAELGILPQGSGIIFFAFPGLAFVHTVSLFPVAYFIVGNALKGIGGEIEDAARMASVPPLMILRDVILPLVSPALALSFLAIFAQVLSDFGLASTIARMSSFSVLTYEIYVATSTYPINFPLAGAQSLVLLVLVVGAVGIERQLRRSRDMKLISGRSRSSRRYRLELARWPLLCLCAALGVLSFALPIGAVIIRAFTRTLGDGLALSNFTLTNISGLVTDRTAAYAGLMDSIVYAAISAVLACVLAVVTAILFEGPARRLRGIIIGLAGASVAIPGIVFAFGEILMWNRLPGFRDMPFPRYGEVSLLVLGYFGVVAPYALIIVLTAVGQLSEKLNEAGRVFGAGPIRCALHITVPLVAVSIATAFALNFIHIMFELPVSQLLLPRTSTPAPIFVLRLLNYDKDGLACALSLISMLVAALSGLVPLIAWRLSPAGVTSRSELSNETKAPLLGAPL